MGALDMRRWVRSVGGLTAIALLLSGCVNTAERATRQNSALVAAGYSQAVIDCGDQFRSDLSSARRSTYTPGVPILLGAAVGVAMQRTMTRRAENRFRACLAPHGVSGEELLPIIEAANEGRPIPTTARAASAPRTAQPARSSACTPGGNVLSGGTGYCTR